MSRFEDLIAALEARGCRVRRSGRGSAMCQCPAHDDRNPSLSIKEGDDGRVILNCFAGCTCEEVTGAMGRTVADLFAHRPYDDSREAPRHIASDRQKERPAPLPSPDELSAWQTRLLESQRLLDRLKQLRGWTPSTLEQFGVGFDGERLVFPINDRAGELDSLARYLPGERNNGAPKILVPKGRGRGLFPAPELLDNGHAWVGEGEGDGLSLQEIGLPGVGIPGVAFAKSTRVEEWAPRLVGRDVVICFDADPEGREAAAAAAPIVAAHAAKVRVVDIGLLDPDDREGFDITDLLLEAGAPDARRFLMAAAAQAPVVEIPATRSVEGAKEAKEANNAPADGPFFRFSRLVRNAGWPAEPAPEAFWGLAGEVVRTLEPHSEADPAALLVQLLAAVGNAVGRGPGFQAEGDFHATALYLAIVGETSKARKGSSWGRIRQVMRLAAPEWENERIFGGLSSGEGLVWLVRDPSYKHVAIKDGEGKNARPTGEFEAQIDDPGVEDKRALIMEGELSQCLSAKRRDGNTLSAAMRNLWDHGRQATLTKNSPAQTTDAHISIVGHISRDELRRELTQTDAANGFANRFLFVCSRRSRVLPDGGAITDDDLRPLAQRLREVIEFGGQHVAPMARDEGARELWHKVYAELSEGRPGLVGAITGRAEAQVMRLAVIYAVLDERTVVAREHLEAALAVWRYCEQSALYVFGDALGDPVADEILTALRARPEGMTRTEISGLSGRHRSSDRISLALETLRASRLAECKQEQGTGRPAERWLAKGDDEEADR